MWPDLSSYLAVLFIGPERGVVTFACEVVEVLGHIVQQEKLLDGAALNEFNGGE